MWTPRLRPFLIQSDLSVENGRFRLKPISGFLIQSKKSFFDSTFLDWVSDWGIQSKTFTFSTGPVSRKNRSKKFTPVSWTRRIAHSTTKHTPTCPHPTTQQYHTTAPTLPWLSLLLLLAAIQRGALRTPLASSVHHTTAVEARVIDAIFPTTATPAVAFGDFRLSATPRTYELDQP